MAFYNHEVGVIHDAVMSNAINNPFYRLFKTEGLIIGRDKIWSSREDRSPPGVWEEVGLANHIVYIYWVVNGIVHKFTSNGNLVSVFDRTLNTHLLNDSIFECVEVGTAAIQFVDVYKVSGINVMSLPYKDREAKWFNEVAPAMPFDCNAEPEEITCYYRIQPGPMAPKMHLQSLQSDTCRVKVVKEGDFDHYSVNGPANVLAIRSVSESARLHTLFLNQPIGSFIYIQCKWSTSINRWVLV